MSKSSRLAAAAVIVLAATGLSACGGGSTSAKGPEAAKRGVYTTAVDCADAGRLTFEDCATAMASAVQIHERDAPTYSSLRACVAKEGEGKCEFTANAKYRPSLLAFLIIESTPPEAKPLYAHPKGEAGFRDLSNNTYTQDTEELTFSEHAQTKFEAHAGRGRGGH
ncbi:MAG: DUF1190 domain-containing protein [Hyphomicrobiaceae bacterium]